MLEVHLYTICWNEADMLGFFFRHYDPFVTRYVIYDDGSDDGTLEILERHPRVEVRRFSRTVANSFVASQQLLQDEVWKESRRHANWVIITAIDEHLTTADRNMATRLEHYACDGVTLAPAIGYQMLSETFPCATETLAATRTRGAPNRYMNKLSIFNPDAIRETGFSHGRHGAQPVGHLKYPERDEVMLFHYKNMDFEKTLARQMALGARLGSGDNEKGWGHHYHWAKEKLRASWDEVNNNALDLGSADFVCADHSASPLWWRERQEGSFRRAFRALKRRIQKV